MKGLAFLLLEVNRKKHVSINNKLQKMKEVREWHNLYGEHDIIVKVSVDDMEHLEKVVMNIQDFEEVIDAITMIAIK